MGLPQKTSQAKEGWKVDGLSSTDDALAQPSFAYLAAVPYSLTPSHLATSLYATCWSGLRKGQPRDRPGVSTRHGATGGLMGGRA